MEQIAIHLFCLFVVALSCHGQVAKHKPAPEYLTSYYFWLALGGALGGLFTTASPYLFNDIYEYPVILLLSLSIPLAHGFAKRGNTLKIHKLLLTGSCAMIVLSIIVIWTETDDYPAQHQVRNFFGVKKVVERGYPAFTRNLEIGSTLQGYQPTFPGHELYLNNNLKQLMIRTPEGFFDKPFAVIGLGTGMLACMAKENQVTDFFEIDPLVVNIAQNPEFFTYLRNCPGTPNTIIGDGRLQITKRPSNHYNLIVLDAFNSNAIPMHLLTAEAIGVYLDKLDHKQGLLAFNIITRHADLRGILAHVAQRHGMLAYHKLFKYNPNFPYDGTAEWVFMIPKDSTWNKTFAEMQFTLMPDASDQPLWTDDYSSILPILK